MIISEWVRSNMHRVKSAVEDGLGEDAADTVGIALRGFIEADERNAALHREIRELRARLLQHEPPAIPKPEVTYRSEWD